MIAAPDGTGFGFWDEPPIRRANSCAYTCDSGEISISESGIGRSARYRALISGRYRLWGVEDFDSVIWNSGGAFAACCDLGVPSDVCVASSGVGETTSSRHCGVLAAFLEASGASLWTPVGV